MTDSSTGALKDPDTEEREDETAKMTFLEHLDELRKRLVRIVTYIGVGFLISFYFHEQIFDFLARPIAPYLTRSGGGLTYLNPIDPFTLYMKVALLAGIFLTIPFCLYEVWKFIAPGLYRKEKRYVMPFLFFSILLFVGGGAFCYYIVLPSSFNFLTQFGQKFTPMITIHEYLDLTNMMILGFGLVFEMPVIVAFLSIFGLVTAKFLWTKFQYALVLIVIAAAIISPTGDAFSLMLWAGPMVILYLISIGVAALFGWRRKARGLD